MSSKMVTVRAHSIPHYFTELLVRSRLIVLLLHVFSSFTRKSTFTVKVDYHRTAPAEELAPNDDLPEQARATMLFEIEG